MKLNRTGLLVPGVVLFAVGQLVIRLMEVRNPTILQWICFAAGDLIAVWGLTVIYKAVTKPRAQ